MILLLPVCWYPVVAPCRWRRRRGCRHAPSWGTWRSWMLSCRTWSSKGGSWRRRSAAVRLLLTLLHPPPHPPPLPAVHTPQAATCYSLPCSWLYWQCSSGVLPPGGSYPGAPGGGSLLMRPLISIHLQYAISSIYSVGRRRRRFTTICLLLEKSPWTNHFLPLTELFSQHKFGVFLIR